MADTSTNMFLTVAKLKGRENYTTWKIIMENLLSLDGLWKSVLGIEASEEKIAKAKAKIVLSVDETLYIHVEVENGYSKRSLEIFRKHLWIQDLLVNSIWVIQ